MKTSEDIAELASAMAQAQGQLPTLGKGRTVTVRTKSGSQFSYSYTTFDDIVEALRKVLPPLGLSYMQMPTAGDVAGVTLTTRIMHKSGQWVEDTATFPLGQGNNDAQGYGAGLTYARRYALSAAFGIATEEDTDANGGDGIERTIKPTASTPPQANESGERFFECVEFGVFKSKSGKMHLGFMAEGSKWPDARWWRSRDEFIAAAPWIGQTATKDDLGIEGNRWQGKMRVYYEEKDGWKTAVRFELPQ